MKKIIIAGNWKMNPQSPVEASEIVKKIKKNSGDCKKTSVILFPPLLYLGKTAEILKKTKIAAGAQGIFWEEQGAYTGRVSSTMIKNDGVTWTLAGHSETRMLGDSDEAVRAKLRAAVKAGLSVILCVGEKERDVHGRYLRELEKQLKNSLGNIPVKFTPQLAVAYEPVWAIGKNATGVETPEGFLHNAIFIRKVLSKIIGKKAAMAAPVLYGGSGGVKNADSFLKDGRADGLLIGRESLDPKNFSEIIRIAENI